MCNWMGSLLSCSFSPLVRELGFVSSTVVCKTIVMHQVGIGGGGLKVFMAWEQFS